MEITFKGFVLDVLLDEGEERGRSWAGRLFRGHFEGEFIGACKVKFIFYCAM